MHPTFVINVYQRAIDPPNVFFAVHLASGCGGGSVPAQIIMRLKSFGKSFRVVGNAIKWPVYKSSQMKNHLGRAMGESSTTPGAGGRGSSSRKLTSKGILIVRSLLLLQEFRKLFEIRKAERCII